MCRDAHTKHPLTPHHPQPTNHTCHTRHKQAMCRVQNGGRRTCWKASWSAWQAHYPASQPLFPRPHPRRLQRPPLAFPGQEQQRKRQRRRAARDQGHAPTGPSTCTVCPHVPPAPVQCVCVCVCRRNQARLLSLLITLTTLVCCQPY